jgi:hypothetical protein
MEALVIQRVKCAWLCRIIAVHSTFWQIILHQPQTVVPALAR